MIADRAIDIEDVRNILTKMAGKLNLRYIRKWLSEFKEIPGLSGVLNKFDKLKVTAIGKR